MLNGTVSPARSGVTKRAVPLPITESPAGTCAAAGTADVSASAAAASSILFMTLP